MTKQAKSVEFSDNFDKFICSVQMLNGIVKTAMIFEDIHVKLITTTERSVSKLR